jgi:uncharacterized protein YlzI (FlbEa/FlbD family)
MIKVGRKNGNKLMLNKSLELLNADLETSSFEELALGDYSL